MLKIREFVMPAILLVLAPIGSAQQPEPQPGLKIDPRSQPAVGALRTMARAIRECPQVFEGETNWGKRPQEIIRVYMGAPTNVIWGVDQSKTPVRSPYTGYIEFSVSRYFWIPPETRDRFDRVGLESAARESGHFGQLWFRYEYDVGPDGAEFSRSLVMGSLSSLPPLNSWGDNPQGGERLWRDAPKDLCWDKAARNPPAQETPAPASNSSQESTSAPTLEPTTEKKKPNEDADSAGASALAQRADVSPVSIKSNPDGADITVDGKYVGSTPSIIRLATGDHEIEIGKPGFKAWKRKMAVTTGGQVTVDATLEKETPQ